MSWIQLRRLGPLCPLCGADLIERGGGVECNRGGCRHRETVLSFSRRLHREHLDLVISLRDAEGKISKMADRLNAAADQVVEAQDQATEANRRAQVLADAAADLEAEADGLKGRLYDLREAWDRLRSAPAGADTERFVENMETAFRSTPRPEGLRRIPAERGW